MDKLLYIGAGLDFSPVIHFSQVREFVFIDTQPRSEFDGHIYDGSLFFDGFYRHKFIDLLVKNAAKFGFELVERIELDSDYHNQILTQEQKDFWGMNFLEIFPDINPNLLIFLNSSTSQIVKYYISTNIKLNMCERIKMDIAETNGLIIAGYHPDKIILEYISKPIKLYCYYLDDVEVDNFNNLIYWGYNNLDKVKIFFNEIYVCDRRSGELTKCEDMYEVDKIANEIHSSTDDYIDDTLYT
jgi:hypothetical protein